LMAAVVVMGHLADRTGYGTPAGVRERRRRARSENGTGEQASEIREADIVRGGNRGRTPLSYRAPLPRIQSQDNL
jgi:hypothetical protein